MEISQSTDSVPTNHRLLKSHYPKRIPFPFDYNIINKRNNIIRMMLSVCRIKHSVRHTAN